MFSFEVTKRLHDARLTSLTTPHGSIAGPFFQFVATQAAIRGQVFSEDLEKIGVQIVLANTYHLHLRPGEEVVAGAGGLHSFMQWDHPMTTDSGGYQVFSLGQHVKQDDDGVSFRSPLDGALYRLTPESTMNIQAQLGADLVMPLDVCTPFGASRDEVAAAVVRTEAWAKRCLAEHGRLQSSGKQQALYGIVQGGLFSDLREQAAMSLRALNFFGYAIGGEMRDVTKTDMVAGVRMTVPHLPEQAPRYLMGAGTPQDIIEAVRLGIDQFDCVLPVRNARHGLLYTALNHAELAACLQDPERPVDPTTLYSVLDIRKSRYRNDYRQLSPDNPAISKPYTIGYVHHLLRTEPPSGYRLAVLHNIHFYFQLMQSIRHIIGGQHD